MAVDRKLLICGLGSVGSRHAKNFLDLDYEIVGVDPVKERRERAIDERFALEAWPNIEEVLDRGGRGLSGAVICSPTSIHPVQIVNCLDLSLPVLTEKPLGASLNALAELNSRGHDLLRRVLVGYTWRWWPALRRLKEIVQEGTLGKVYFARFLVSAHLADWHPWEDYRDFFMASEELGGGALLDESHWIDQMLWFFGMPDYVFGTVGKVSDLDISSDDSVDVLARYKYGLTVSIHLDIYGRPHEKTIQIIGSKGVAFWSEASNEIHLDLETGAPRVFKFSEDRNFMFQEVAREFDRFINGDASASCTWEDGVRTLRVIEAIRESNTSSRAISLQESSN